jgi:hypothetical protein
MSYEMIPVAAVQSAAGFLAREWGEERYSIGGGRRLSVSGQSLFAFECGHSDGSRWFLVTDRWGNVSSGDTSAEAATAWVAKFDPDSTRTRGGVSTERGLTATIGEPSPA